MIRVPYLLSLLALSSACGALHSSNSPDTLERTAPAAPIHVVRQLAKKPGLSIIERDGDPAGGLAFAAKSSASPAAIIALSQILANRLKAIAPGDYSISPNAFGFTIGVLIDSPERAHTALNALDLALSQPIEAQFDQRFMDSLRAALPPNSVMTVGERNLASCSGDILTDTLQTDSKLLREAAEQARRQARSFNNSSLAIVGNKALTSAVENALRAVPSWPKLDFPRSGGTTQRSMAAHPYTSSVGSLRRLSVAWRVRSASIAETAAQAIRQRGSPLLSQLSALDEDWRIEDISSVARDAGGCLRIDLGYANDNGAMSLESLRTTIRLVSGESRRAIDEASSHRATSVLTLENDPQLAARRLAWQALSTEDEGFQNFLMVHVRTLPTDSPGANFEAVLREAATEKPGPPIEASYRQEFGQTELWAILASSCGADAEGSSDAGSTAAWLQSLARRFNSHLGVQLEPYVTEDGLGLIAHGPPRYAGEPASAIAVRLGDAIGSVIATGAISGSELAMVREDNFVRIGASPRRAWWQMIEVLSAGHPATFEPLGTFDSLRTLDLGSVRSRRLHWLKGPLKIAALLNRNRTQASDLQSAMQRWLGPHRSGIQPCTGMQASARSSQEVQIAAKSLDPRDANAYLAVQLGLSSEHSFTYEHWLHWLLVRPGGWLETALVRSGNIKAFTADIKGPRYNRTLIIGLNSEDDTRIAEALARVRELLARLRQGPDARDSDLAQAWSEEQIRRAELDPRRRLLDLWRGDSAPMKTPKSGFAKYVIQALAAAPVTVVRVRRQP